MRKLPEDALNCECALEAPVVYTAALLFQELNICRDSPYTVDRLYLYGVGRRDYHTDIKGIVIKCTVVYEESTGGHLSYRYGGYTVMKDIFT